MGSDDTPRTVNQHDDAIRRMQTEVSEIKVMVGRLDECVRSYQENQQRIERRVDGMDEQQAKEMATIHERVTRHRRDMESRISAANEATEHRIAADFARRDVAATELVLKVAGINEHLSEARGGWRTILLVGGFATGLVGLLAGLSAAFHSIHQ